MKPKISIITLGVENITSSKTFYKQLGFPCHGEESDDHFVMFELEGTWLALFPREELLKDTGSKEREYGFSGITLAHNVASKEEVDSVINEARRLGAKVTKEPQDTFWGGYSGYFKDFDGYFWEVAWNPFTDLT
ncbi:VOC family protein [Chloroflexota bacterium]